MSVDVSDSFRPLFEQNEQFLREIEKPRRSAILNLIFRKRY